MSADNWTMCPICHNLPEKWRNGIGHLYGNISQNEFSNAESEYKRLMDIETVREDYELILNYDATVSIWYSAVCENCGAEWMYNKEDIPRTK